MERGEGEKKETSYQKNEVPLSSKSEAKDTEIWSENALKFNIQ